ncbi:hypothetical protein O6H91_07G115100 [Diphasiastrum complanatum]|uniref:Uncharacterized protein n=1 Tax=Diphasiastrum complanatum TaxID=34168 RepID=A0ACC2D961_DIPCM|nr:hypothetical protein O6H91_07G115100 [Diphasiastrum complanatum]
MAEAQMDAPALVADLHNGQTKEPENGSLKAGHEVKYRQLRPHLIVQAPKASEAIEFYKKAFGALEIVRTHHPKRKADQEHPLILHAHLKIGGAELMICEESDEDGPTVKSPPALHGTSVILHLETSDVDVAFSRAIEAGAQVTEEITNQPWGQRYGKLSDPFGFVWSIATPIKEFVYKEASSTIEV